MYKILIALFCLVLTNQFLNAQEVSIPRWTDFCETGYENAVYKESKDVFNIFSFVKAERVKKNYWAQRRVSFENNLKTCEEMSEDAKDFCYQKLIDTETQKNELYGLKRKEILYESNIRRY